MENGNFKARIALMTFVPCAFMILLMLVALYQVSHLEAADPGLRTRYLWITGILGFVFAAVTIVLGVRFSKKISGPLGRSISTVADHIQQVSAGSAQVFTSAQQLADGSNAQASSLEETSSSLEELSSMTKQNADNASQARAMMQEAGQIVEKVNRHMDDMAKAITEITRSSEETGKIIKTIDEIAFQTNLLALNAAVEAARAGEAGAGFAVVADEVRNLAMRSAEAAKNTSELIENTIKAVKNGNELTSSTQEAFKDNIVFSEKISQLVDEIATASQEQAHGIAQINRAVAEMDKVVQKSAYSAESSAAAAESMNSEVNQLKNEMESLASLIGVEIRVVSTNLTRSTKVSSDKKPTAKLTPKAAVSGKKLLAPPAVSPKPVSVATKAKAVKKSAPVQAAKAVRPEQVIPFDEDDFKDF